MSISENQESKGHDESLAKGCLFLTALLLIFLIIAGVAWQHFHGSFVFSFDFDGIGAWALAITGFFMIIFAGCTIFFGVQSMDFSEE